MKAVIDIKTPAGKSFDGFPREITVDQYADNFQGLIAYLDDECAFADELPPNPNLHPGDTITITIQKD